MIEISKEHFKICLTVAFLIGIVYPDVYTYLVMRFG
jgi:hypothetical protein